MKLIYEGRKYAIGIKDRYNFCVVDLTSAQDGTLPDGRPVITYTRQWFFHDIGNAVQKIARLEGNDGSVDLLSWLDKYKAAVKDAREVLSGVTPSDFFPNNNNEDTTTGEEQ